MIRPPNLLPKFMRLDMGWGYHPLRRE